MRNANFQRSGSMNCRLRLHLDVLALFLLIAFFATAAPAQTYKNPVIPGDFPDPTVIRVGDDFYAATTSGNWAPHFPLLHSRDLVNWKIIGAVLTETPKWAKGDFWAPEIIEDKGRYFVYYVGRRQEGRGRFEGKETNGTLCVAVAAATMPVGPYIDKGPLVCQQMGSIDPFFVRDENDKPYLIWKEDGNAFDKPTWLWAQQLDESGTKLLGKPTKLFRNTEPWEGGVVEGAYVLRRDGWFYFFYSGNACCGRRCNYAMGVARSKVLLGNWEKNPRNPILGANSTWQCPGHGDIVGTDDGRQFLLYHAYRRRSDAFSIGRETLLDEVKFENGWPMINNGRGPSNGVGSPFQKVSQYQPWDPNDEFSESLLLPQWNYPIFSDEKLMLSGGFLTLTRDSKGSGEAVVTERTVSGNYTASTRIAPVSPEADESAGLSVYGGWRGNSIGISLGKGRIFTWRRDENKQQDLATVNLPAADAVVLRINAEDGETFRLAYSTDDGRSWNEVGQKISKTDIEGARLALIYDGRRSTPGYKFDWFRVKPD
jgi:xylan 1,4-beta-xylosidase